MKALIVSLYLFSPVILLPGSFFRFTQYKTIDRGQRTADDERNYGQSVLALNDSDTMSEPGRSVICRLFSISPLLPYTVSIFSIRNSSSYQFSIIWYTVSCILNLVSLIQHLASSIQHPESWIEYLVSLINKHQIL